MSYALRRATIATVSALLLMAFSLIPAAADQAYPTERLPLAPIDDAPLHSGFVVNVHANGPKIYAHEIYVLNGAEQHTTYDVVLHVYLEDLECAGNADLSLPTASLTTNPAGNGRADAFFTPEDVAGLRGMTVGAYWSVGQDGSAAYASGCTQITLD